MADENIRRPPNGYALSLYDDLQRSVRELPLEISYHRDEIRQHRRRLKAAERTLADAASTLAWMQEHQADEIAALEAARAKTREALEQAGWFRAAPATETELGR